MKKNELRLNDFNELILCLDAFLLAFRSVIGFSNFYQNVFFTYITIFIWSTVCFVILLNNYTFSQIIRIVLLFLLVFLIYYKSSLLSPFFTMLYLIAVKNTNIKKILKWNFAGIIFSTCLVILSYFYGLIDTNVMEDGSSSLGFNNPNTIAFETTIIVLYWIYFRFNKLSVPELYLFFLVVSFMYYCTKSRTGLLLNIIILLLYLCFRYSRKLKKLLKQKLYICVIIIPYCCFAGVWFCSSGALFSKLNTILSGRMIQAQFYLFEYGLHLFGAKLDKLINYQPGTPLLDMGYARLILQFGFIYFVIFFYIYFKKLQNALSENDYPLTILLFTVFLGLITENVWLTINYNFITLFCAEILFNFQKKDKKLRLSFLKFNEKKRW